MVATQIFFIFTPKIGEDEPFLTSIFFKGVGKNQPGTVIPKGNWSPESYPTFAQNYNNLPVGVVVLGTNKNNGWVFFGVFLWDFLLVMFLKKV